METTRLRPGRGFSIAKFVGYYSLRFVPYIWLRRLVARILAWAINSRKRDGHRQRTPLPSTDSLLETLAIQGVAFPPPMQASQVADIREYLRDKLMISPDGRRFTEANAPSDVHLATYPFDTVMRCPFVIEWMNAPEALELAERYLGCVPTISAVRIDWSSPGGNAPEDVQRFHRDHDDWAFLKYFVYLTDVGDDSGPHEFVRGSHRRSARWSAEHYADEEVHREFGRENVLRISGPTGTAFFEDTWGVHKGAVPSARPRLLFQAQYSILPVFKYNYRPLSLPGPSLDAYINRLLLKVPTGQSS